MVQSLNQDIEVRPNTSGNVLGAMKISSVWRVNDQRLVLFTGHMALLPSREPSESDAKKLQQIIDDFKEFIEERTIQDCIDYDRSLVRNYSYDYMVEMVHNYTKQPK